jgi:Zinc finger, C3HC4 type (RING finger)
MAQETPFSFHCMICFEEFHPDERYPVVLPCGHTYVCNCCADRLEKCMECRTPLFTTIPQSKPIGNAATKPAWSTSSRTSRFENAPPPQIPIKKRLPLPKNVVLLSLIEATELATENAQKKFNGSPRSDSGVTEELLLSTQSEEEEEEEKIKMGVLAAGVTGTYAVADREGLEIFPSRPFTQALDSANALSNEDVDTLVRFFHLDQQTDNESRDSTASPADVKKELARLSFGDRVQIVSIEFGWAKLARGYGFIKADRMSLVKGMMGELVVSGVDFALTILMPDHATFFVRQWEVPWIVLVGWRLYSGRSRVGGKNFAWSRARWTINSFDE